jgi:hypothetical protein
MSKFPNSADCRGTNYTSQLTALNQPVAGPSGVLSQTFAHCRQGHDEDASH